MGECQYNVFAILKPVVVAVRSLNGLPYIEIKLAEKCHTERSQSQAGLFNCSPLGRKGVCLGYECLEGVPWL